MTETREQRIERAADELARAIGALLDVMRDDLVETVRSWPTTNGAGFVHQRTMFEPVAEPADKSTDGPDHEANGSQEQKAGELTIEELLADFKREGVKAGTIRVAACNLLWRGHVDEFVNVRGSTCPARVVLIASTSPMFERIVARVRNANIPCSRSVLVAAWFRIRFGYPMAGSVDQFFGELIDEDRVRKSRLIRWLEQTLAGLPNGKPGPQLHAIAAAWASYLSARLGANREAPCSHEMRDDFPDFAGVRGAHPMSVFASEACV